LTASYQKVFSDDPKLGFFSQRDRFQEALDNGEVLAPAKNLDEMQSVVTNSTVDGILAALFAVMIIVVILDASRIWFRVIVGRRTLPTMESPFVASRLYAPAGLIPTAEERAVLAGIGAGAGSAVETDRFTRESPDIEPTSPRGGP
jgi:carbon starvation protein